MRPNAQIHPYSINVNNAQTQPPPYPRSPRQFSYNQHKSPIHITHHHEQPPIYSHQTPHDTSKKYTASIRSLEEKMENVEALVRKKSARIQIKPVQKPQYYFTHTTIPYEQSQKMQYSQNGSQQAEQQKKDESQPDLRISCPNVFKKFEQTSLRNTTHIKNLSKLNTIIADLKKQESSVQASIGRGMKKNDIRYHIQSKQEPLTPQYKKMEIKPSFKSLNDIWNHKVVVEKPKEVVEPKLNVINGFYLSKQLGKGKFGEVYLGRHIQTGAIFALKKIVKARVRQYKMVQQFKAQIRLHSCLQHPNIVKFYGFFEDHQSIYLILQYINGGTLFDYMVEKDILDVNEAAEYLKNVIEALAYMHDRSIAHRDIKPQNIVLTTEGVAKLCDFGWSALVETSRKTYCGTFDYAPPQILQHKQYDTSVDLWCIGVLTYEVLTGRVPFEGEKRKEVMQKILSVDKNKIDYPVEIAQQAKDFIEILVQKDPQLRPKCKNLLKHKFFQKNLRQTKVKK